MTTESPTEAGHHRTNDLAPYLHFMVKSGGSDLFMTVGAVPTVKVQGEVVRLGKQPLVPGQVKAFAYSMMSEAQMREFERNLECDLAVGIDRLGRFRFNVYMQRGEVSLVARYVKPDIPSLTDLKMPAILQKVVMQKRGLVLSVGAAGSGKSSTLAAMIDHRNRTAPGHILTIEDPIEFLHPHHLCVVDQREVGLDTHSFEQALRHGLREAPDVIMIGEIRDEETMNHAMKYAETGHLCLATLHSNNANQAVDRMINFFPEGARKQALLDLSLNLKGVIAQRLIRGTKRRLVPATEVMLQSAFISDLIQKGEIDQIKSAIGKSTDLGMHTFDQSLYDLYQEAEITLDDALENADSRTDLSLRIRMHAGADDADLSGFDLRRG
ncbi:PilT/PilU family type 4a pilus ATPase [Ramlibacter sp.]|uniref:PilT/PilU family type 4a pilus ATPase n=1 Tax=Ramlibacter sp. TaxID=1917967 RepID=UPI0035ADB161